ncbi:DUF3137 domain-containing protein [Campylobacter sp.]|uniref:DUF3137 domain-containing protein n=1 Tax=Campylobacter sp. TaxID=205 RepID=UPI0036163C4E
MSEIEIEYEKFYKEVFINAAIQNIDPLFTYNPTAGIVHEVIDKNKIYPRKKLVGEYKIEGTYNNVKFSFGEVKKLDSSGVYITSGSLELAATILVLVATWKILRIAGNLLEVRSWSAIFTRNLAVASRTLNTKFLGEKERMDDVFFSKEFRVFADDKVEARYLLTPAFMERLRELKEKFAGEMGVSAAFMDDKFYLFLNGAKNKFETTLFSLPPSLKDAAQIKKEISELLSIIDELNLSLDIFK